jgi:hypothetical protein
MNRKFSLGRLVDEDKVDDVVGTSFWIQGVVGDDWYFHGGVDQVASVGLGIHPSSKVEFKWHESDFYLHFFFEFTFFLAYKNVAVAETWFAFGGFPISMDFLTRCFADQEVRALWQELTLDDKSCLGHFTFGVERTSWFISVGGCQGGSGNKSEQENHGDEQQFLHGFFLLYHF